MANFAQRMVTLANRLIVKYGSTVTLVHSYNCAYDPVVGDQVCTVDEYPFKGAISSYTLQESISPTVDIGDLSVLIETDLEVTRNWQVKYGGRVWEVIDVVKTIAQDTLIVQRLQIRALSN